MSAFDYILIAVYLVAMIACGILLRGRQESAEDYFTGGGLMGGRVGRTLVGLSIAATYFSGISFVAFPSIVIASGTKVFFVLLVFPIAWAVVHYVFLPRYFAVRSLHPYEIVAVRLGPQVRTAVSALFVLLRLGWMATLLYAPTIVILTTMRLGDQWFWPIILVTGVTSTLYTTLGGLRGVIVTDAIQMVIIIAGLAFALLFAVSRIPFDIGLWSDRLSDSGAFTVPSLSLSPIEQFSIWGILVGMSVSNMASYTADQMGLQRFLATGSLQSARYALRHGLAASMITVSLLATIGLVVTLYYSFHPDPLVPKETDKVFPYFIASALPMGLSGLIVSAILAATMSSITSGVNAVASCVTFDFIRPLREESNDEAMLKMGRWISLGVGLAATFLAGMISRLGTIFDISQTVIGVFIGPILAIVTIAVLFPQGRPQGRCIVGIVVGCGAGVAAAYSPIQSIWITVIGFASTSLVCLPPSGGRRSSRQKD